jgi:hypothetical protein
MQSTTAPNRIVASAQAAMLSKESEPALTVVTVYQDSLMRHWTAELWDRVGQLVGQGGIRHRSWKIGNLTNAQVFAGAVQAAAEAEVLVVSVRDAGELPVDLYVWIDAWMPRRTASAGALVALIGVSPEPDAESGHAHAYLEAVARRVGLDFLPRERKLPETSRAITNLAASTPPAGLTMPWLRAAPSLRAGAPSRQGLTG